VERLGHINLPDPYAPRSRVFRKATTDLLRKAKVRNDRLRAAAREDDLRFQLESHQLHTSPAIDNDLRSTAKIAQLRQDIAKLQRRIARRDEQLVRTFDRVQRVLSEWGYIGEDGWSLTDAGMLLSRVYSESDLLIAEALRTGLFADLTPAEVAALTSCLTYESRGRDATGLPSRWPTKRLSKRFRELEAIWRDLAANEDDAGIEQTRAPDAGFVAHAFDWVQGRTLSEVIMDDELTGGDFVRQTRQLIDVLRQIADSGPDPAVAHAARSAADASFRGVIAVSAIPEIPSERIVPGYDDLIIEGVMVNGEPLDGWEWTNPDPPDFDGPDFDAPSR
jgi:ATP-dependent RNA helicase HelY